MLRMCSTLLKNWYKNILKRFLMRNAWNIHHFLGRDRCSPMINRWNVRKQKLVSTQIPFYVLVGWNKHREPQYKDGKDKLKTSGSIPRTKMQMDSTEKQLNSSGYFPWISNISILKEIQMDLEERTSRSGSSSCLCTTTFCGKQMMRIASRTLRKSKNYAKKLLPGHWTFVCPGSERDSLATLTMDSGIAQPRKWYSNKKKLVILSSQAPVLWVVESWSREEAVVL